MIIDENKLLCCVKNEYTDMLSTPIAFTFKFKWVGLLTICCGRFKLVIVFISRDEANYEEAREEKV